MILGDDDILASNVVDEFYKQYNSFNEISNVVRFSTKILKGDNLSKRFKQLPEEVQQNEELIQAMRHYDYTVNVKWVLAHYNAAGKYLGGDDKELEATGGSNWRKYLHPKYQRRP